MVKVSDKSMIKLSNKLSRSLINVARVCREAVQGLKNSLGVAATIGKIRKVSLFFFFITLKPRVE